MENASSIATVHRGPVPQRRKGVTVNGKVYFSEAEALEAKRATARAYYHANKQKYLASKRAKYKEAKGEDRSLPVQVTPPEVPVRKRPGKIDALIACHRAADFARSGDVEGAELWSRFAARMLEGKE